MRLRIESTWLDSSASSAGRSTPSRWSKSPPATVRTCSVSWAMGLSTARRTMNPSPTPAARSTRNSTHSATFSRPICSATSGLGLMARASAIIFMMTAAPARNATVVTAPVKTNQAGDRQPADPGGRLGRRQRMDAHVPLLLTSIAARSSLSVPTCLMSRSRSMRAVLA